MAVPQTTGRNSGRWLHAVPVAALVAIVLALGLALERDPSAQPSALIGRAAPATELPPVTGYGPGFSVADFQGQVTLLNVFASWCVSCRVEHPLLMALAESGEVQIFGLAYKDDPRDSALWLDRYGSPYAATAADVDGRAGIEWGVYGVPETFVIGPDGRVAHRHIGPLTLADWQDTLAPRLAQWSQ